MTKGKMKVEEYLLNSARACQRDMVIRDNFQEGKAPNVFWYQPVVMNVLYFDWKKLNMKQLSKNKFYSINFSEVKPETFPCYPDYWKVDKVTIVLTDSKGNKLLDRDVIKSKTNNPYPNQSYVGTYKVYKRKHYYGIATTFPDLKAGSYELRLTEYWNFDDEIHERYTHFQRSLCIPINVSDKLKPFTYDIDGIKDFSLLRSDDENWFALADDVNREFEWEDKTPNYTTIGHQTFALDRLQLSLPYPIYDLSSNVVFSCFEGTKEDLYKAFAEKYKGNELKEIEQQYENIDDLDRSFYTDYIASMVNAHASLNIMKDHAGQGMPLIRPKSKNRTIKEKLHTFELPL